MQNQNGLMQAMVLDAPREKVRMRCIPRPRPGPDQLLIEIAACAVCRTDLHVVDGELPHPKLPIIPGHEIVGRVIACGADVRDFALGERIGIPWLGWTCGHCRYCLNGQENLCPNARFTGYQIDGGYAEYTVADARYCFRIPDRYSDSEAAPLLCAGLIGYRALKMTGNATRVGIYGFGAAAHIVAQILHYQGRKLFAFTRPGDATAQEFAHKMGAAWAGSSDTVPPEELDAAIIFAPVGALVPIALRAVCPGGIVVCGGIHMSDIPAFPYDILWREKRLVSVANLTRQDGEEFLKLAPQVPIHVTTESFPLSEVNTALTRLREGKLTGAAVLIPKKGDVSLS
ncbi:alcohol dehydrogenase, propanol-preferring [Nitrosospira multiformis]|uniref:alcohol dehydrogenase n=1 Tax=Nitrosospira multiformis TaxID=1231 RepID=A0A1H9YZ21_9PROT|nr:zinc-dependent alcohol dehydrogenase family protein [Nitrosospira multiformis]SES73959.1 alcohol dehydrogenase, propanol-preferring [Nitrosospira multiformis]